MEGPLKLTGSLFHHTYYFKFDPPILQKYKNTTQQYPLETYDISAVNTKVLDTSRLYGFQNSFGIFIASKQPLILIAKDEKEQQAWIKELCKYCIDSVKTKENMTLLNIIEAFVDPCVIANRDCYITGFNRAACLLFGYTKQEVLGSNVNILMPPAYSAVHHKYVENYYRTGVRRLLGIPRILPAQKKDGNVVRAEVQLSEVESSYRSMEFAFIAILRPVPDERPDQNDTFKKSVMKKLNVKIEEFSKEIKGSFAGILHTVQELQAKVAELQKQNDNLLQTYLENDSKIKSLQEEIDIYHGISSKYLTQIISENFDLRTSLRPSDFDQIRNIDIESLKELKEGPKGFLRNKILSPFFINFCKKEFSIENPLFWTAVEKYKELKSQDERKVLAKEIYNRFVKQDALLELNIDNAHRMELEKVLHTGNEDIFDGLQKQIETVMNDTYHRFERSKDFEQLLKNISLTE